MNAERLWGRVVVGVDGSAGSVLALREAQRIAKATGARLDVVSCWLPLTPGRGGRKHGARCRARPVIRAGVQVRLRGAAPWRVGARRLRPRGSETRSSQPSWGPGPRHLHGARAVFTREVKPGRGGKRRRWGVRAGRSTPGSCPYPACCRC
ncbi:hypothetical protein B5P43_21910 [Bacillus sp. SRB_336]|nr:hypothetical protein B5P43_21910 [Bacillus sp. SRB_336]